MENCTIYSHLLDFEKIVQIVAQNLPKATIETQNNGREKAIVAHIKGGFFGKSKELVINYMERVNPSHTLQKVECDLTQNLVGMVNFIQNLPAKNEAVRNQFIFKAMSANCQIGFMVKPDMNADFLAVLRKIVLELDGFVFASPSSTFNQSNGQHFLDKNLNLILDTNGNCSIQHLDVRVESKYQDPATESLTDEQRARKARTEAFLMIKSVKVNAHLPCVVDSDSVEIRSQQAVVERVYALLMVALRGEGVERERLEQTVVERKIMGFSPQERAFYDTESPDQQASVEATWRYESLFTLMWALGLVDELPYPDNICDVGATVEKIIQPSREAFEQMAKLRSKVEILDELDKIYRMNWACVDAQIKGQPPTGNLNRGVVYERHYALNWLTCFDNQDWDDVQTHT